MSQFMMLLVEDDRATYCALKGILTLRGWEVIVATTIAEARLALDSHLDAVIQFIFGPHSRLGVPGCRRVTKETLGSSCFLAVSRIYANR